MCCLPAAAASLPPYAPPSLPPSLPSTPRAATDGESLKSLSFELGWLLYALASTHLKTGATDHLVAYHTLAAVIHLLLSIIPEEAQTSTTFWTRLDGPIADVTYPLPPQAQQVLWESIKAVPAEMDKLKPTVAALLAQLDQIFALSGGAGATDASGALTPTAGAALRALLAPSALGDTVEKVRAAHAAAWRATTRSSTTAASSCRARGGRRGRRGAAGRAGAGGAASSPPACSPARASSHASLSTSAVQRSPGLASPARPQPGLLTPLRGTNPMGRGGGGPPPQTPMTSQLEAVSWLREATSSGASCAADLRRYLDACDPPVTAAAVSGRVDGLCAKVKQALLAAAESGGGGAGRAAAEADADEQIGLGCRLYYKMLDRFLSTEEQRSGAPASRRSSQRHLPHRPPPMLPRVGLPPTRRRAWPSPRCSRRSTSSPSTTAR